MPRARESLVADSAIGPALAKALRALLSASSLLSTMGEKLGPNLSLGKNTGCTCW